MEITVPVTLTADQYQTLAEVAEANGFGDLTLRQCLETRVDLWTDEARG